MTTITKKCATCHSFKPISDFYKSKHCPDGLTRGCKTCCALASKKSHEKNRDKIRAQAKKARQTPEWRAKQRQYWHANKSKFKDKENARRRTPEAKEKARIATNKWRAIPHNRIAHCIRERLRKVMIKGSKAEVSENLLGTSFENCKTHLESLFKAGMTWDNYGKNGWHIDHIVPCASFDLTDPIQQKICFHYLNLQPMWASENIAKWCLLPELYQETLDKIKEVLQLPKI